MSLFTRIAILEQISHPDSPEPRGLNPMLLAFCQRTGPTPINQAFYDEDSLTQAIQTIAQQAGSDVLLIYVYALTLDADNMREPLRGIPVPFGLIISATKIQDIEFVCLACLMDSKRVFCVLTTEYCDEDPWVLACDLMLLQALVRMPCKPYWNAYRFIVRSVRPALDEISCRDNVVKHRYSYTQYPNCFIKQKVKGYLGPRLMYLRVDVFSPWGPWKWLKRIPYELLCALTRWIRL